MRVTCATPGSLAKLLRKLASARCPGGRGSMRPRPSFRVSSTCVAGGRRIVVDALDIHGLNFSRHVFEPGNLGPVHARLRSLAAEFFPRLSGDAHARMALVELLSCVTMSSRELCGLFADLPECDIGEIWRNMRGESDLALRVAKAHHPNALLVLLSRVDGFSALVGMDGRMVTLPTRLPRIGRCMPCTFESIGHLLARSVLAQSSTAQGVATDMLRAELFVRVVSNWRGGPASHRHTLFALLASADDLRVLAWLETRLASANRRLAVGLIHNLVSAAVSSGTPLRLLVASLRVSPRAMRAPVDLDVAADSLCGDGLLEVRRARPVLACAIARALFETPPHGGSWFPGLLAAFLAERKGQRGLAVIAGVSAGVERLVGGLVSSLPMPTFMGLLSIPSREFGSFQHPSDAMNAGSLLARMFPRCIDMQAAWRHDVLVARALCRVAREVVGRQVSDADFVHDVETFTDWVGHAILMRTAKLAGLERCPPNFAAAKLLPLTLHALGGTQATLEGIAESLSVSRRIALEPFRPQASVKSMRSVCRRWHEALARLDEEDVAQRWPRFPDPPFAIPSQEQWEFTVLSGGAALVEEGRLMRHCVASRAAACACGTSVVLKMTGRLSDMSTWRGTLEFAIKDGVWEVSQLRGKLNADAPEEACRAAGAMLASALCGWSSSVHDAAQ